MFKLKNKTNLTVKEVLLELVIAYPFQASLAINFIERKTVAKEFNVTLNSKGEIIFEYNEDLWNELEIPNAKDINILKKRLIIKIVNHILLEHFEKHKSLELNLIPHIRVNRQAIQIAKDIEATNSFEVSFHELEKSHLLGGFLGNYAEIFKLYTDNYSNLNWYEYYKMLHRYATEDEETDDNEEMYDSEEGLRQFSTIEEFFHMETEDAPHDVNIDIVYAMVIDTWDSLTFEEKSRGTGAAGINERIEFLRNKRTNTIDWHTIFRKFVGSTGSDYVNYSYRKPNKRFPYSEGAVYKNATMVHAYIDVSGSMSRDEISEFYNELLYFDNKNVIIHQFDVEVYRGLELKSIDLTSNFIDVYGRGGTTFESVSKHANELEDTDCVIIYTDGRGGSMTDIKWPVVWLSSRNGATEDYMKRNYKGNLFLKIND